MEPSKINPKTNIVIPVKGPGNVKNRLSGILSKDQRNELFLLLFDRVLDQALKSPSKPNVLVVSDSNFMIQRARAKGASILQEEHSRGETESVEAATCWSIQNGFQRQLVIPGDLADMNPEELETLLGQQMIGPSAIFCPATDDDGTNAILTSPPNLFAFRFGEKSFPEYLEKTRAAGAFCKIMRLPSFVLDIDTPDDLETFLRSSSSSPALELLNRWRIQTALPAFS